MAPFEIDEADLPRRRLNFLDLESAIEIYTPLYQLFLTDSDFWRACNSLQLDETVALYTSRLIGDASYVGLVNNKHPLVSTVHPAGRLQAPPCMAWLQSVCTPRWFKSSVKRSSPRQRSTEGGADFIRANHSFCSCSRMWQ